MRAHFKFILLLFPLVVVPVSKADLTFSGSVVNDADRTIVFEAHSVPKELQTPETVIEGPEGEEQVPARMSFSQEVLPDDEGSYEFYYSAEDPDFSLVIRYLMDEDNYCDFTFTPSEGSFDITANSIGDIECSADNIMKNLKVSNTGE